MACRHYFFTAPRLTVKPCIALICVNVSLGSAPALPAGNYGDVTLSFELLLDAPDLQLALVDDTLYASTVLAEASETEIFLAVVAAMLDDMQPDSVPDPLDTLTSFEPLDWQPPQH